VPIPDPCDAQIVSLRDLSIKPAEIFANERAADRWLEENDPEGVAFEYEVME
jgi:hypothetical protein